MASNKKRAVAMVAVTTAITFATCVHSDEYRSRQDSITDGLGDAPARNIAVQTINPWPPSVQRQRIDIDGDRLGIAISRYKLNRSIPPRGLNTQSISIQPLSGSSDNSQ